MAERVAEVSKGRDGVIWIQEMLPRHEVIQFYSHAAVFCCPSVYEPFGIINLEAMACETAVVASAIGGIPEVVVPDETGLLIDLQLKAGTFDPVDPAQVCLADLAAAINRVARDPALAATIRAQRPPARRGPVFLDRHRPAHAGSVPITAGLTEPAGAGNYIACNRVATARLQEEHSAAR